VFRIHRFFLAPPGSGSKHVVWTILAPVCLKGALTQKRGVQVREPVRPERWTAYTFKNFCDRPFKSCDKSILHLLEVNIKGTLCPVRRQISSAVGHGDRKAARTGGQLGLRLATRGTVSLPFFRLRVTYKGPPRLAPPAGRYSQTGFMRCSLNCHCRKQWVAKDKISIYIVKANFSKIVAFRGTIRKFSNMLAVHIEGSRPSPYASLKHFFRVSVLLKVTHSTLIRYMVDKKHCLHY
jgi:hypothetical protein